MTSFDELNNNLNEYNLVRLSIKYSGGMNMIYQKLHDLMEKYGDLGSWNDFKLYNQEILSLEFIREFQNFLEWGGITKNLKRYGLNNIEFIREFQNKIHFPELLYKLKSFNLLNLEILLEFGQRFTWYNIVRNEDVLDIIDLEFIKTHKIRMDWTKLFPRTQQFNMNINQFIEECKDILDWYDLTKYLKDYGLDNFNFIEQYKSYIGVDTLILYQSHLNRIKIFEIYKDILENPSSYLSNFRYSDGKEDFIKLIKKYNDGYFHLEKDYGIPYMCKKHSQLIIELKDYLNWDYLSSRLKAFKLNKVKIVRKIEDKINWDVFSKSIGSNELDKPTIFKRYGDKLQWHYFVSKYNYKKYIKYLPYKYLFYYNVSYYQYMKNKKK